MKDKQITNKVLVIGVDGATFSLIKPWVQKGLLPNFKNLLAEGIQGNLESTLPPITGPAWSSFQTGKNPGKHGIFDWLIRDKNSYSLKPIDAGSIKDETLWEILSKQGKKVAVVNVPVTYPPKKVNGVLVSGMLTPSQDSIFTYPASLKAEIEQLIDDYEILPAQRFEPHKMDKWINGLKKIIEKRKKLAIYLMEKYAWDFFMVHFIASDVIQHRMWDTMLKQDKNPVLEIYQEIDKAIGEIVSILSSKSSVFVISDHGFGPLYYHIYLNNWLMKEGYLHLKTDFLTRLKKLMYNLNITPGSIYKLLGKIGVLGKGLSLGKGQRYNLVKKFFLSSNNIDWKRTRAYAYGNIGQIYINTIGREPQGCITADEKDPLVEEIILKLKKAWHPVTNDYLFERVLKKEQIYSGKEQYNAPEILLLPKNMEAMAVGVSEFVSNKIVEPSFAFSGGHRMEGILIAKGEILHKGREVTGAKIIDLAPTILYCLGLPIPDDMDGKVLQNIFTEEILKTREIRFLEGNTSEKSEAETKKSAAEERIIKKRLADLGYIE